MPRWQAFLADVGDRMTRVRDDADALLAFNTLAARVGVSHFVLDARGAADALPNTVTAASGPPLVLTMPRPETALLTARKFPACLTAEQVQAVFEQIVASGADDLIVDLRGNRGGWFVSLAIASHLLDRDVSAGVELGRGWWTRHAALPTAAEAAALPELSAYDLPGFYRTLRDAGAMRATVRPALPRFAGRVVVPTDGRTASAAEPLANVLKATGRATVIGQTTMGAVLTSERLDLPGGGASSFRRARTLTQRASSLKGAARRGARRHRATGRGAGPRARVPRRAPRRRLRQGYPSGRVRRDGARPVRRVISSKPCWLSHAAPSV